MLLDLCSELSYWESDEKRSTKCGGKGPEKEDKEFLEGHTRRLPERSKFVEQELRENMWGMEVREEECDNKTSCLQDKWVFPYSLFVSNF